MGDLGCEKMRERERVCVGGGCGEVWEVWERFSNFFLRHGLIGKMKKVYTEILT